MATQLRNLTMTMIWKHSEKIEKTNENLFTLRFLHSKNGHWVYFPLIRNLEQSFLSYRHFNWKANMLRQILESWCSSFLSLRFSCFIDRLSIFMNYIIIYIFFSYIFLHIFFCNSGRQNQPLQTSKRAFTVQPSVKFLLNHE